MTNGVVLLYEIHPTADLHSRWQNKGTLKAMEKFATFKPESPLHLS